MRVNKNSDVIMLLGIEHQRITQVLNILERQIDLVEQGAQTNNELIELAIDYFLTFPDTCHHPKEDLLFARVMSRAPDEHGVVGDLISEHKELSQLTHRVRDELDSRSENDIVPSLKKFLRTYRHHIETENTKFFPYVLANLSQEEFDVIDFDLFDSADPVYDNETEERFSRLREEIVAREGVH